MIFSLLLSLILAPFLAFLLYSYLGYRFKHASFKLFYQAFFWGILSVILPLLVYWLVDIYGYSKLTSLRRIVFYSFFVIGFIHEFSKFLVLRYFILPAQSFKNPSDGILFSVTVNLGSMSLISILFLTFLPDLPHYILLSNTMVSLIFAVIMGFFVGMGKVRSNRFIDSLTGLFGAAFFHGIYQFIVETNDLKLMIAYLVGSIFIAGLLIYKAIDIADQLKLDKSRP
ncbi:MAG TPA: hypothetical protein DCG69_12215 [Bacteroidales bacterium]|nr:hypothetical protein [Bacteroidales bacterium]